MKVISFLLGCGSLFLNALAIKLIYGWFFFNTLQFPVSYRFCFGIVMVAYAMQKISYSDFRNAREDDKHDYNVSSLSVSVVQLFIPVMTIILGYLINIIL